MDHYKVLGLSRTATKDEIKQAFRKLAVKFHPDKHSLSPKPIKDDATRKFKQVSEAYEVLIDDHKRADYNIRNYQSNSYQNSGYGAYNGANYGGRTSSTNSGFRSYGYESRSGGNYGYGYSTRVSNLSRFEVVLRYMTTRSFLVNFAFAGVILGGSYIINKSGEALWKMHNPGKSFDDVMESVEKAKAVRDDKI